MNRLAVGLAVALAILASRAQAACAIEALGETHVQVNPAGLFEIPASIKAEPVHFLIDTGAMLTTLDLAIVDRLRLPRDIVKSHQIVSAFGRSEALARTTIPELVIGGETLHGVAMLVAMGPPLSSRFDGLLGADFLSQYDLEFDVADNALRFFKRSRCGSAGAVYWSDRYSELPIAIRDTHIILPLTLDGRPLHAMLDSGAARTTLSWRTAERLAIDRDSPKLRRDGWFRGLDGHPVPAFTYGFQELRIAGEVIRQPVLAVGALEMKDADMILGADFIRAHRVYIATGDDRLYFTWNGTAGFAR